MAEAQRILDEVIAESQQHSIVQYKGLREISLNARDREVVQKICMDGAEKVANSVHGAFQLIVHFKQRSNTGKRHRYTVSTRVIVAGGHIVATEANDWDVRTALHRSFDELQAALEHHFKPRFTPSVKKLAARSDNDNLPGELSA